MSRSYVTIVSFALIAKTNEKQVSALKGRGSPSKETFEMDEKNNNKYQQCTQIHKLK